MGKVKGFSRVLRLQTVNHILSTIDTKNQFILYVQKIFILKIDCLDGNYEYFKYLSVRNGFFTTKESNFSKTYILGGEVM